MIEFIRVLRKADAPPPMVCDCPWSTLFIWADGTVSYCGRTPPKGDLRNGGLRDFWNSQKVQEARSLFLKDRHLEAECMPTCNVLTAKRSSDFIGNYFGDHQKSTRRVHWPRSMAKLRKSRHPPAADQETNALLMQDEIRERYCQVSSGPSELHIQISDYCSLRCPMCCCGIIDPAEKAKVTRVIDRRILDELNSVYPFIRRIEILGGEPFDQPFSRSPLRRIIEDVAACREPRPLIKIATNGNNLNDRWIDFILHHDFVDILSFSIDSVDPDVYARTRIGGSLGKVLSSVQRLRERRAQGGSETPKIYWTSVLGLHTLSGIPAFVHAAQAAGAVRVDFQPMNPMGLPEFHMRNNIFDERHVEHLGRLLDFLAKVEMDSNSHDIITMTVAFLRRAGRYDVILNAEPALKGRLHEMGLA
jgi:MoaA/NifB/PqqE/SkfB family radical SAM enzyme